jgi:hypothetical protein
MLMSSSGFPGTAITSAKYPAFSSPMCPPYPKSFAPFSKFPLLSHYLRMIVHFWQ